MTRITLRYVSLCIRLEFRRVRAKLLLRRSNAIAERLAVQPLSRPVALRAETQWPLGTHAPERRPAFLGKLSKERLRILQIGSFEAFGEPAVDRREQVVGFPPLAPTGPKPGKIAGGSKLEDARRSVAGIGQCGVESGLGDLTGVGVASQAGARAQPGAAPPCKGARLSPGRGPNLL